MLDEISLRWTRARDGYRFVGPGSAHWLRTGKRYYFAHHKAAQLAAQRPFESPLSDDEREILRSAVDERLVPEGGPVSYTMTPSIAEKAFREIRVDGLP
jgi:hypothetical protein